jgi:hypothetical protein
MWERFTTNLPVVRNITSVNLSLSPHEIAHTYKIKVIVAQKHNPFKVRYLIWLFPEFANIANGVNTMARKVWEAVPLTSAPGAEDSIQNN